MCGDSGHTRARLCLLAIPSFYRERGRVIGRTLCKSLNVASSSAVGVHSPSSRSKRRLCSRLSNVALSPLLWPINARRVDMASCNAACLGCSCNFCCSLVIKASILRRAFSEGEKEESHRTPPVHIYTNKIWEEVLAEPRVVERNDDEVIRQRSRCPGRLTDRDRRLTRSASATSSYFVSPTHPALYGFHRRYKPCQDRMR